MWCREARGYPSLAGKGGCEFCRPLWLKVEAPSVPLARQDQVTLCDRRTQGLGRWTYHPVPRFHDSDAVLKERERLVMGTSPSSRFTVLGWVCELVSGGQRRAGVEDDDHLSKSRH
jgi:hypothetical protein